VPSLLVIADDLSGATDVGAQFAKQGIPAFVSLAGHRTVAKSQPPRMPVSDQFDSAASVDFKQRLTTFQVVLFNTESRHLSPDEARSRVKSVVRLGLAAGVRHFYKKTDSTLRGNVGAELEALLEASRERTLGFIPAHPQLGRTTRDGIQYVQGQPLHESAFGRDPRNPIRESRVAAILARQTVTPITEVPTTGLASFEKYPPAGIMVFDAGTVEEVQAAAHALGRTGCLGALAGPAALAACLPDLLGLERMDVPPVRVAGPMLVVNGSLHEVALRQCALAVESGFGEVRLPVEAMVPEEGFEGPAGDKAACDTAALLAEGRNLLLWSVTNRDECAAFEKAGALCGLSLAQLHDRVATNTGELVRRILQRVQAGVRPVLVIFGGDTLLGIARALGWSGLIARDEILPGVAVSEVAGSPGPIVITKPGGFGPDEMLARLAAIVEAPV
jgi:uncharacterized protein YgbK (DUF1537 family)